MSGFTSFLKSAGHFFKEGLDYALPFAKAATTAISIVNPALGALLQTSIATVVSVEQKFTSAGKQDSSGPQKLAEAVTILEPVVVSQFAQYGVQLDTAGVQKYINAVVGLLNVLPTMPAPQSK
jgi:hypothetical protein